MRMTFAPELNCMRQTKMQDRGEKERGIVQYVAKSMAMDQIQPYHNSR